VSAGAERELLLLLDTHVLVWSVEDGPRLGSDTKAMLDKAAAHGRTAVSGITPWEIGLLVSKGRLELDCDVMEWVRKALSSASGRFIPLEPEIAVTSSNLPFEIHADPADRILVATARRLGAVLVTADGRLLELAAKGHFQAVDASR
jgi:PIN domain nuclease of toxin-antitoxin system